MKEYIGKIRLVLMSVGLAAAFGCANYAPDLDEIHEDLNGKDAWVTSINQQIEKINASIPKLEQTDKDMKDMIGSLEETAGDLRKAITENGKRISAVKSDLEKAVEELRKSDNANKEELIRAIEQAEKEVLVTLETMKSEMNVKLSDIGGAISDLKKKDADLEGKISDLKSYAGKELKGTEDWVKATFATLEQYNDIVEQIAGIDIEIAGLKTSMTDLEERLTKNFTESLNKTVSDLESAVADEVAGLNDRISKEVADLTNAFTEALLKARNETEAAWEKNLKDSVNDLKSSLESWVNDKIKAYWTIEETKAALETQKKALEGQLLVQKTALEEMIKANSKDIEDLKAALAVTNKAIEDNAKEVEGLKSDLDEVKAEVKEAYERAIRDAIASLRNELSADITAAINDADSKVQGEIDRMSSEIRKMEKSVSNKITQAQNAVNKVLYRIQSLVYVPYTEDGVAVVTRYGSGSIVKFVTLEFEVRPSSALYYLKKDNIKITAHYPNNEQKDLYINNDNDFKVYGGYIVIKVNATYISDSFVRGEMAAFARVHIENVTMGWNLSSEYIPLRMAE
jgi:chromosome segregation ATPase